MVELYDGGGGLPYLGSSTSYNAGDWENALRTYADTHGGTTSSVYLDQIAQVDTVAQKTIDRTVKAAKRARHHHGRRHGHARKAKKLAVVLDIDETSLSNLSAIEADNFTFGPNSQAEATSEIGKAIPATLKLFNDAKARGVAVFFITGRGEATRAHTESNLTREGYSGFKQLYLKPAGSTLTTVAYKTGARQDIENQGYTIIANIGDQYSDLAGGHAASAFKLPNPFYFLP
jgi:predicted secreted acid phosphatase